MDMDTEFVMACFHVCDSLAGTPAFDFTDRMKQMRGHGTPGYRLPCES